VKKLLFFILFVFFVFLTIKSIPFFSNNFILEGNTSNWDAKISFKITNDSLTADNLTISVNNELENIKIKSVALEFPLGINKMVSYPNGYNLEKKFYIVYLKDQIPVNISNYDKEEIVELLSHGYVNIEWLTPNNELNSDFIYFKK